MTLNEFAYEVLKPDVKHPNIYESLDSGQNTQIVGHRQSGRSTVLAVYMAYHLITNTNNDSRTIMFTSFNSTAGMEVISVVKELVVKYYGGGDEIKVDMRHKLVVGNNIVEYYDAKRPDSLRDMRDVRAIIVDETSVSLNDEHYVYSTLIHSSKLIDAQVVWIGKRPRIKQDINFNFFPIQWIDSGLVNEDMIALKSMFGDTGFHTRYERMTPYFTEG